VSNDATTYNKFNKYKLLYKFSHKNNHTWRRVKMNGFEVFSEKNLTRDHREKAVLTRDEDRINFL
jgi:hypothetical protein